MVPGRMRCGTVSTSKEDVLVRPHPLVQLTLLQNREADFHVRD